MVNFRIAAMVFDRKIYLKILMESDAVIPILELDSINLYGLSIFEHNCIENANCRCDIVIHQIISKFKSKNNYSITDLIDMIGEIEERTDIDIASNLFI